MEKNEIIEQGKNEVTIHSNKEIASDIMLEEIISKAIQIPGVKVDRSKFLAEGFSSRVDLLENIINNGPVEAGITREEINNIANKLIMKRTSQSSIASFAAGIPGTVGGSIYGNAGAYNACLLDYVRTITVLDEDFNIKVLNNEDITYGYRTTSFKENKQYIIVAAKFYVTKGDKENSLEVIANRRQRRIESQPLEYPSAGSVFRNPQGDFAGRLIESCNLKGYKIGGAEVSEKHANFVINKENATGKDVHDLIMYIHDTVKNTTDVDLKIEQEFIDWE